MPPPRAELPLLPAPRLTPAGAPLAVAALLLMVDPVIVRSALPVSLMPPPVSWANTGANTPAAITSANVRTERLLTTHASSDRLETVRTGRDELAAALAVALHDVLGALGTVRLSVTAARVGPP